MRLLAPPSRGLSQRAPVEWKPWIYVAILGATYRRGGACEALPRLPARVCSTCRWTRASHRKPDVACAVGVFSIERGMAGGRKAIGTPRIPDIAKYVRSA